jgi:hypothetical protein
LAVHRTTTIIGETEPALSMTALRAAAKGGRGAIIDKPDPLAKTALRDNEWPTMLAVAARHLAVTLAPAEILAKMPGAKWLTQQPRDPGNILR